MKIIKLYDEYESQYTKFVTNHQKGLFYYQLEYRNILKRLLSCNDEYYILIDEGEIKAILPLLCKDGIYGRVYNSLPYFGSNGSILSENTNYYNVLISKYNEVIKASAISTYIENPLDIHEVKPDYDYVSERVCQISHFTVADDMDDLSKLFTSNKRNDVRKAIKSNIVVEIDNSKEAKDFLLTTHLENMKTIGGIPKSELLFNSLYKIYVENQDYNIFIAKKDGKNISGLLVLYFNEITEYYTPVTVKEYREFQPLALVIYEAIRFSVRKGCTSWNWGGNGLSLDGVYKFKKRWGAEDYYYNYYIKLNDKTLLGLDIDAILNEYSGFFTIPFHLLNREAVNG